MNKKTIMIGLAVSICVVAIISNTYLVYANQPDTSYDMHLTVANNVGVNADTDAIWFGTIPPEGKGTRQLVFYESGGTRITIKTAGELASWVSVSDNNFVVEGNTSKTIDVYVSVPSYAEHRDYVGKLNVYSS